MKFLENKSIVLFDGVCNLCNNVVQFIIEHDKNKHFLFASLQSDAAQDILLHFNKKNSDFDSVVLIENEKIFEKSSATLKIAKRLSGIWKYSYALIIIPKFIRDFFYTIISQNRYKWFGKKEDCMMPTAALKARFLD
ncbi:thiol-disulfide oxidoreductase DCC family protein [Aureibaculum sp. 2210JD6-5]|uniref:thiol-disulfide oxidoreductase DCC family protein n=1 Tax=Aureibaculum sp. 2210JD6-5 TaxID=3103957 RepID=UPI002AADDC25|nr:thiol-disulfide oxidoreductase DCC family protein [Aureibaculum sp. 2210JD6-5]MDY7393813.1 thiol-disulfide oxidoreductase DCC family protein [Aureibaculum sp. 2210JD6-5]